MTPFSSIRGALSALAALAACAPIQAAEPILFFKASEVPTLQERITQPGYKQLWDDVLATARKYSDPQSPEYADAAAFTADAVKDEAADARGHHQYGRELSTWLETLGFAYQMTGDPAFGKQGSALLLAATNPSMINVVLKDIFPGSRGDMMRALAVGLDLLSGAMTPEDREKVAAVARTYLLAHVEEYSAPDSKWTSTRVRHNFSGVCGGAVGMLGLALREDFPEEAPAWIDLGEKMVIAWLDNAFDREGAYPEGILYQRYGLGNSMIFASALWRAEGRKAIIENPRLQKVPYFLAMEMLPGEVAFDPWNDSLYLVDLGGKGGSGSPFLLLMGDGFQGAITPNPLAAWLWSQTGSEYAKMMQIAWGNTAPKQSPRTVIPQPYGAHFADRGLCVWRTGWERADTMFSIAAGPYHPITHDQADKGHFNYNGLGYRWAVDPGYGNNKEPQGRSQTVAHSCVLVDMKGQALSGAGLGTDGRILQYENTPRYGYALIDALPAYLGNNAGMPGTSLTKALRHSFFVHPADGLPSYAIILDDIEDGTTEHEFTWQMVAWENMAITNDGTDTFVLRPPGKSEKRPHMKLTVQAVAPVKLSHDVYKPDAQGGRPPNVFQRLRAATRATNPRFVALLAPLPAGAPEPSLTVTREEAGTLIEVAWGNRTDRFRWSGDDAKFLNADEK